MPQHKSAEKRAKQNLRKKNANLMVFNQFRSSIKNFEASLKEKDKEKIKLCLQKVNSLAFRAVKKGIIKKKGASRTISKLSRLIKS